MTSSRALPQNLGPLKIQQKCTKIFEKIREKGLTFWPGVGIMIKRQVGVTMPVKPTGRDEAGDCCESR